MSIPELQEQRRKAKEGMFSARSMKERAGWMVLHKWVCEEIRKRWTTDMASA